MEYVARLSAPSKSNKYYYSDNIFYQCGYGMPNCTCYAWGRWYELLGSKPKLCTGNAENWYKFNDGYERGKIPRVGAIAVWRKGQVGVSSDGAGHVAVVEEVGDDGSFLTSNSAWQGANFYTRRYYGNYNNGNYIFLGFIYLPMEFDEDKPIANKELDAVAREVIAGKWGNGEARFKALAASGYDADAVQARVNYILSNKKSVDELAREVMAGKWGNGADRKNRLTAAGYNYDEVQARVNEIYY